MNHDPRSLCLLLVDNKYFDDKDECEDKNDEVKPCGNIGKCVMFPELMTKMIMTKMMISNLMKI